MRLFQKKCWIALFITCITVVTLLGNTVITASAYTFTPEKSINSQAAIVYSQDTNQILYEKNADQQQMPGHLAQIMTAIVVMEACDNTKGETITADDSLYQPLYQYSEPDDLRYADIYDGDTLTVQEYLYAMMLTSSCEAALILANHFGGSVSSFVDMMNEKAAELGCENTTFTNPTGLYDISQTTTARDLLTITEYALSIDGFEEIASTQSYTPKSQNLTNHPDPAAWVWTHSNTMLTETSEYYYEGAIGIKTGNLEKTGRSIITMATRDNTTYLVILLNAPFQDSEGELQFYHLEDAAYLLDWAFSKFSYVTLLESNEETAEVEVLNSDGNSYVLVHPESDCILLWCNDVDTSAVQKIIHLEDAAQAPVKTGEKLGTMELKFSGEVIATVDLVAVSNVGRSYWKYNIYALENFPHSPWFLYGILAGCVLTALYITLCIYAAYRARRDVTPEDPIHLIPHATQFQDRPKQNWKRDDTVFYHGPNGNENSEEKRTEKQEHYSQISKK